MNNLKIRTINKHYNPDDNSCKDELPNITLMNVNANKKKSETKAKYSCTFCNYNTSDKKDYTKHLSTKKHIHIAADGETPKNINKQYICLCGKIYKFASGLSIHKKKCNNIIEPANEKPCDANETINYNEIINSLMMQNKLILEENKSLQNTISDLVKKLEVNQVNQISGNVIVNNNNFGIINLLNDKCKDAISMTEFIETINIDVSDLEYTGKKGLIVGISNIFAERFNNLPPLKRPLWCIDIKRHKLLIKEDEWIEDDNQKKTKDAIKTLGAIQAKNTVKYAKENPDWINNDIKKDTYMEIIKQTTSDIDEKKVCKIISNITDQTHLTQEKRELIQELTK